MHLTGKKLALVAIGLVAALTVSGMATAQALLGDGSLSGVVGADDSPVSLTPQTAPFSSADADLFRSVWSQQSSSVPGANATPAEKTTIEAHARTQFGDGVWFVTTYTTSAGLFCAGLNLPEGGQGISCLNRDDLFRDSPVSVWPGARQAGGDPAHWNVVWIYGFADDSVSSIDLVSTNCSRASVPLDADGVFLVLAGPKTLSQDIWPYRLEAYDATGQIVVDRALGIDAPDTEAAKEAGVQGPAAAEACP